MLSQTASEFTHVSDRVLDLESALQSQDEDTPSQWQVISIISGFINYFAEKNRIRYGHYAFDLDPRNAPLKSFDAQCVLDRMELMWGREELDDLPEDIAEPRRKLLEEFAKVDERIKSHLKNQPDFYAIDISQKTHRKWMLTLRILGETERDIVKRWKSLMREQSSQDDCNIKNAKSRKDDKRPRDSNPVPDSKDSG